MRFRSEKQLRWFVGTTLIIALFLAFGWLSPVQRMMRVPTDAVGSFLYTHTSGIRQYIDAWRSSVAAKELLPPLIRENEELSARIALLEAENGTLRRQLAYPMQTKWRTVGADVIAKTADVTEQALILNQGSNAGIETDDVVYTENGVLVGRIMRVESDRSIVRLLQDKSSRVGALLATTGHAVGIVEGGYGLGMRLTLIPPEEAVTQGNTLVTGAQDEKMPPGLLIGSVNTVGRETYEPFQHALVAPAISYDQVKSVMIILKK